MPEELHAGYILSGIRKYLRSEEDSAYWADQLRGLSFFVVDVEDWPTHQSDSLFCVVDNLLSRGLPTLPSCFVEDTLAEVLNITRKEVSERTGALRYPLCSTDPAFAKTLQDAFAIIDPRVTPHDDDILLEMQSWEEHDSPYEELFLKQIAPRLLGDFAFQVLEPQRRIEAILQFDGDKKKKLDRWLGEYKRDFYDQRVDFAVQFPKTDRFARGLVIEIDGGHHREDGQRHLDRRRNAACKKAGWDTLRIETREINNIPEEKKRRLRRYFEHPYPQTLAQNYRNPLWECEGGLVALQAALTPIAVARIQKVLTKLLRAGTLRLDQDRWRLAVIERDVPCAHLAVEDYRQLLAHLFELEGNGRSLPDIELKVYTTEAFASCVLNAEVETELYGPEVQSYEADVLLDVSVLQRYGFSAPSAAFTNRVQADQVVIIRSAHAPKMPRRIKSAKPIHFHISDEEQPPALVYFLNNIFRKVAFREGQVEILRRTLTQQSVIGLLPTGAGKSLTYQLSTLLQPGVTLIVDPIKSLMRDQNDNLLDLGIDATTFINSTLSPAVKKIRMQRMVKGRYQFVFISPERLVIKKFRGYLEMMDETRFVYCVVDEAHCVSEWGHDFRTTYLSLGTNTRRHCKTMTGEIPIVALTGTASFDVLSDVQRELFHVQKDTGTQNDAAIVTPAAFERKELHLGVVRVRQPDVPEDANAFEATQAVAEEKQSVLFNILQNLPARFGKAEDINREFFALRGDETVSGLVFSPHKGKKGETGLGFGVIPLSGLIKSNIPELSEITSYYAGSDEDDEETERMEETQQKYKNNKLGLLVATKAFGMGIDKPNIRYTIHFNMPPSIESFYQEAGRAGRDRQDAHCMILYCDTKIETEHEPEGVTVDKELMLTFHRNSFRGPIKEKRMLDELLREITFSNLTAEPGIEAILAQMKEGDLKPKVRIGFENDKIVLITNYLRENVNRRFNESIVRKSCQWCYTAEKFVQNLNWQFRKNCGEWSGRRGILNEHIEKLRLPFARIRDESDTFKAVYRLSVIGVVADYTLDYKKPGHIYADVKKENPETYINNLVEYIGRYVSVEEKRQVEDEVRRQRGENIIQKCLGRLVDFVYKRIAKKRREAIDVMEIALRTGIEDGNEAFAAYVNTYFDSRFTPELRDYLRDYSLDIVWDFMERTKGEPDALNHLRGACDRLLEVNPDNAALLLLRAFARFILPTYGKEEARIDFRKAWKTLEEVKGLEWRDRLDAIDQFFAMAMSFDASAKLYWDEERAYQHLQWLRDFNKRFLKKPPDNDEEELPDGE